MKRILKGLNFLNALKNSRRMKYCKMVKRGIAATANEGELQ
jgi:hypothetical protein